MASDHQEFAAATVDIEVNDQNDCLGTTVDMPDMDRVRRQGSLSEQKERRQVCERRDHAQFLGVG